MELLTIAAALLAGAKGALLGHAAERVPEVLVSVPAHQLAAVCQLALESQLPASAPPELKT